MKSIYSLAAFLMLFLSSCENKEEVITETPKETPNLLSISRVVSNSTDLPGGFGMFVLNAENEAYNENQDYVNMKVTHNGSKWVTNDVWLYNNIGNVIAYHPYNSAQSNHELEVDLNLQKDFLATNSQQVSYLSPIVNLEFKHILSRINFTVEGFNSLQINDYQVLRKYNMLTKNFEINDNSGYTMSSDKTILLLYPGTPPIIKFTIGNKSYNYNMTNKISKLLSGEQYNITLQVQDKELCEFGNIEVKPWNVGGNYQDNIY